MRRWQCIDGRFGKRNQDNRRKQEERTVCRQNALITVNIVLFHIKDINTRFTSWRNNRSWILPVLFFFKNNKQTSFLVETQRTSSGTRINYAKVSY